MHDALNRPILVVDANKGNTEIDYDRVGHVLQYHHPNKTSINYTYDLAYNTLSVVNRKDDGTKIDSFQYAYDKVGNRLSVIDNVGKTIYAYDNTYQLIQTNYPDKDAVSYVYDKAGNRVRKTEGTDVTTYDYNPANMILRAGNEGFTFDGNGNMTSRTDTTTGHTTRYTYDTENRMVGVTLPDGSAEKYGYDFTNMRISSDVPGVGTARDVTRSLWDGNDVLNETSANHSDSFNVVRGVNLSKMDACDCCSEARMMFYHFDALGSVSATTDLGANITQQYRYDDFGKVVGVGTGEGNDLQFVGSLGAKCQGSTGLIYMRNRWYDTNLGRFMVKDPIRTFGSRVNRYRYVVNNPILFFDELGLEDPPPVNFRDIIPPALSTTGSLRQDFTSSIDTFSNSFVGEALTTTPGDIMDLPDQIDQVRTYGPIVVTGAQYFGSAAVQYGTDMGLAAGAALVPPILTVGGVGILIYSNVNGNNNPSPTRTPFGQPACMISLSGLPSPSGTATPPMSLPASTSLYPSGSFDFTNPELVQ